MQRYPWAQGAGQACKKVLLSLQDRDSRPGNRQCKGNWKGHTEHVPHNEAKHIGHERGEYTACEMLSVTWFPVEADLNMAMAGVGFVCRFQLL